ncbi:MAG: polysaccharide biosynthesis tyrosine autokinase [Jatrophihabitans sp.]
MELREYLHALRKGWPFILAFVVIGTALGTSLTVATAKVYQADVQVFVATSSTANAADLQAGTVFSQNQVQSYTSIATSPTVTQPVIDKFGLKLTQQELSAKITADAPATKVLINLHVTDHDPGTAAKLANAVAAQFDGVVERTEQTGANGKPVVKLSVIHPARVPTSPIKPSPVIDIGLGFILGLLIGIAVVILREALDNTVKGPEDFAELGVAVLGIVPFDKRTPKNLIAFRADPHGTRSEAYRQLRTNLQFVNVDNAPRIIAVTSGVPGEGKTTTAVNLAAALAEGGFRVCLVEADLRRPTIAKSLGLVADVGFTSVLVGKISVEAALQNVGRNLAVLTSGPVPPNPSELLISEQAESIIREVSELVDYTIIDTAPLLPVADGAEVSAMADATLVVHHAGKSTRDQAARSIEALDKVGERPVGVILNMMTRTRGNYGDNYGYYYTYRPDRSWRKGKANAKKDAAEPVQGADQAPAPAQQLEPAVDGTVELAKYAEPGGQPPNSSPVLKEPGVGPYLAAPSERGVSAPVFDQFAPVQDDAPR